MRRGKRLSTTSNGKDNNGRKDLKRNSRPTTHFDGDLVLIENDIQSNDAKRKLLSKYYGLYTVKRVIGKDQYLIEDKLGVQITTHRFCPLFSLDRMKGWCKFNLFFIAYWNNINIHTFLYFIWLYFCDNSRPIPCLV